MKVYKIITKYDVYVYIDTENKPKEEIERTMQKVFNNWWLKVWEFDDFEIEFPNLYHVCSN